MNRRGAGLLAILSVAALASLAVAATALAKGTAYVAGGNAAGEIAPHSIGAGGELTPLEGPRWRHPA